MLERPSEKGARVEAWTAAVRVVTLTVPHCAGRVVGQRCRGATQEQAELQVSAQAARFARALPCPWPLNTAWPPSNAAHLVAGQRDANSRGRGGTIHGHGGRAVREGETWCTKGRLKSVA